MIQVGDVSEDLKNILRMHLAQCQKQLFPIDLGNLAQLQTMLKIIESEAIVEAIGKGSATYYPQLVE